MTNWGRYRFEGLIVVAGLSAFILFLSFFIPVNKSNNQSENVISTNDSPKAEPERFAEERHSKERHVRPKEEGSNEPKKKEQPSQDIAIEGKLEQKTEAIKQEDNKNAPEENIVIDRYETIVYLGGLTVRHIFEEKVSTTSHKAFLDVYPNVSVSETLAIPVKLIKKEISKYTRGAVNNIEAEMLLLLNKELNKLFHNGQTRRLPSPDGRIVIGVKMVGGDDGSRHLYFGFDNGQWMPINDEFLIKIIQSTPM